MAVVLFICHGNVGRNQVAEAFFNKFSKNFSKKYKAISAGIKIDKTSVGSTSAQIMKEVYNIDMSSQKPKQVTDDMIKKADKIIFVGYRSECNILNAKNIEYWNIHGMLGKSIENKKKMIEKIRKKVVELIKELG